MTIEKRKNFIINALYIVVILAVVYVMIKYVLGVLMPFIVGFLVSYLLKPLIQFISHKTHIPRKLVAVITVILSYGAAFFFLSWLGIRFFIGVKEVIIKLPGIYSADIEPAIYKLFDNLEERIAGFDPLLVQAIQNLGTTISQSMGSIFSTISSKVIGLISSSVFFVPGMVVSILISFIASLFFAMDYDKIHGAVTRALPTHKQGFLKDVESIAGSIGYKYIKAYGALMTITFLELSIGLSILRINNAVTIAALIAVLDILPVLGTGGILVPWVIIEFIKGNPSSGIGLLVLYMAITVIRNILEPKLVGKQVGMHPLVILICIYVGLKLFGFMGIFVLPITVVMMKHLHDSGKISLFTGENEKNGATENNKAENNKAENHENVKP